MKVHEMSRNAYVIRNFEMQETILQSYNSVVAVYDEEADILTLGRDWDYSITTLKQLYNFIQEYVPSIANKLGSARDKRFSIQKLIDNMDVFYNIELH